MIKLGELRQDSEVPGWRSVSARTRVLVIVIFGRRENFTWQVHRGEGGWEWGAGNTRAKEKIETVEKQTVLLYVRRRCQPGVSSFNVQVWALKSISVSPAPADGDSDLKKQKITC